MTEKPVAVTPEASDAISKLLETWSIAPGRDKTRDAIRRALLNVPASLLVEILARIQILVIAPDSRLLAATVPFVIELGGQTSARFSVVYLEAEIETYDASTIYTIVQKALREAFASVIGWSGGKFQTAPSGVVPGGEGRPN
jgi:hypothetical protein